MKYRLLLLFCLLLNFKTGFASDGNLVNGLVSLLYIFSVFSYTVVIGFILTIISKIRRPKNFQINWLHFAFAFLVALVIAFVFKEDSLPFSWSF